MFGGFVAVVLGGCWIWDQVTAEREASIGCILTGLFIVLMGLHTVETAVRSKPEPTKLFLTSEPKPYKPTGSAEMLKFMETKLGAVEMMKVYGHTAPSGEEAFLRTAIAAEKKFLRENKALAKKGLQTTK